MRLRDHAIRRHYALCLFKLGCALAAMGDHKRAVSNLRESLPIFLELGLPGYEERAEQVLRESCGETRCRAWSSREVTIE